MDRHQLAQALEYAGWARNTNLDALAGMYHGGPKAFWDDWTEFTGTQHPVLVNQDPQLFLVARSFDFRTSEALDFLVRNKLPVKVLRVAFYVDATGRRVLDVEWEKEPSAVPSVEDGGSSASGYAGAGFREITLAEVAAAVGTPAALTWSRPRKGQHFTATLLDGGRIRLGASLASDGGPSEGTALIPSTESDSGSASNNGSAASSSSLP